MKRERGPGEVGFEDLWGLVLREIEGKLDQSTFQAYFGKTMGMEDWYAFTVRVSSPFLQTWLENQYREEIADILFRLTGRPFRVRFEAVAGDGAGDRAARVVARRRRGGPSEEASNSAMLNSKYSFENFVVGPSNQFAHAAALAVAEAPAKSYNPLFLYGGVGLGKTHLMQAVAHYVLRKNPDARIIYCSAEQFTNEFINSLKDKRMDGFHRRYRSLDVLLVDDVQFLANKDRSQEDFLHTVNELYEAKRQLVIPSDRPPRDIPTVEDRLRSRLEWGLVADVKPPNLETRTAILRKKAEEAGVSMPDEVVQYIASRVRSNIRELEGGLMKVAAMASLTGQRIDLELAADALKELVSAAAEGRRVTIDSIQRAVAGYFQITPQDLKGKKRTSNIAFPRQVAMFLCRDITESSLPIIGTEFGGRDHTTVLYSCQKIKSLLGRDKRVRAVLEEIKNLLV